MMAHAYGEGFDRGGAFGEFQWLAENLTFEADVVPVHGDRSAACLPVDIAFGVDGGDDGVAFKGFVMEPMAPASSILEVVTWIFPGRKPDFPHLGKVL